MISRDSILNCIATANIEDIVRGEGIDLKKAGTNLKGCCPFHDEKTPSFSVSPAKNIYKCFGCGKGGGPVNFLMERGKTFPEAIQAIAQRYSIELEFSSNGAAMDDDNSPVLRAAAETVKAHFLTAEKDPTEKYWTARGFTAETIAEFQLGYCDGSKPNHIPDEVLKDCGLLNEKGNLQLFKRAIIPVHDRMGRVVSFAGRALDDKQEPKYLNGPDTDIYSKSGNLFNLHRATPYIRQKQELWIVEGYADVMACWQMGVRNVIGLSGLYLSDWQLGQIKKFNGDKALTLYLCIDNQVFGSQAQTNVRKAFEKLLYTLTEIGEVKTVHYPNNAKDAADLMKAGMKITELTRDDAVSRWISDLFTEDWLKKASPVEIADQQDKTARLLAQVKRQNVLDIYINNLAERAQMSPKKLEEAVKNYRTKSRQEEENKKHSEYRYIKVLDDYYERSVDYNIITGATNVVYRRRKATELRFEGVQLGIIPRFANWITVPDHLNYKRVIEVNHEGTGFRFFNEYHPLPYKPLPFDLPEGFLKSPETFDMEQIPEVANIARFIKHLTDSDRYGNRYTSLLWDWLAICYLHPKQRLPALALVSTEEGTGKSTWIQLCMQIFGQNATKTDAMRIAGNFNAQMAGKILICVEETKDEKGDIENKLKDLITSFEKVVEVKHQDARVVQSFDKFIFASNHPDSFMKVGSQTTRFFVLQVPKISGKVHDFEQVLYREIPYLLYLLEKRGVLTPQADRLWFDPKLLENEALLRLRQASKDVVVQNMEELLQNIFLRCEITDPVIRFNSEYVTKLMQLYGGKMYEQKTPNYFSKVATTDLRCRQSEYPGKFDLVFIKTLHESGGITAGTWSYETQKSSGRYIEFPIWKFLPAADVVRNFTQKQVNELYEKLQAPKLQDKYPEVAAEYAQNILIALKAQTEPEVIH